MRKIEVAVQTKNGEKKFDSIDELLRYCADTVKTKNEAPKVKGVKFIDATTHIYWSDGSRTSCKCEKSDIYDKEKGFLIAYLKKFVDTDTIVRDMNKYCKEEKQNENELLSESERITLSNIMYKLLDESLLDRFVDLLRVNLLIKQMQKDLEKDLYDRM